MVFRLANRIPGSFETRSRRSRSKHPSKPLSGVPHRSSRGSDKTTPPRPPENGLPPPKLPELRGKDNYRRPTSWLSPSCSLAAWHLGCIGLNNSPRGAPQRMQCTTSKCYPRTHPCSRVARMGPRSLRWRILQLRRGSFVLSQDRTETVIYTHHWLPSAPDIERYPRQAGFVYLCGSLSHPASNSH